MGAPGPDFSTVVAGERLWPGGHLLPRQRHRLSLQLSHVDCVYLVLNGSPEDARIRRTRDTIPVGLQTLSSPENLSVSRNTKNTKTTIIHAQDAVEARCGGTHGSKHPWTAALHSCGFWPPLPRTLEVTLKTPHF